MVQTTLGKKTPETQTKAHELAGKQREIGVAEFFSRNRHLLGFDNKRKALMTTVKEAVDNSLDACEEANVLPEIIVDIIEMNKDRYRVIIEDNGPGIVKAQVGNIFAKLLYGSKFHRLKQSRGQQGIGISASVMYAQLTTGRPAKITTKIGKDHEAQFYKLRIDTKTNKPDIEEEKTVEWDKDQGTRIEVDLEASYIGGGQSVDEYLRETAITNPHATIIYTNPKAEQIIFPRVIDHIPHEAQEIQPHPYGVELGILIEMLGKSECKTLQQFLTTEFSKVSATIAKQICENGAVLPTTRPKDLSRESVEQLLEGIKKTKIQAPSTDCLSPIGQEAFEKGLKKEINAEFYASSTRPPQVYRGNPFIIEVGLAYGGQQPGDAPIRLMRYANRVPLLYQQGACGVTKAITGLTWRTYGLNQSKGNLPVGPLTLAVHIASVWVPFTSESKEAVAHYPEIIKEIKLGIQEVGRKLAMYVRKKKRILDEGKKRGYIEKYIPHVQDALVQLLDLKDTDKEIIAENLTVILEESRGKLEDMKFDPTKNEDYDEDFAKIGRDEPEEDEESEEDEE
ncbi:DNA topoisomerase VI subunit B [Candidatus Woesearchaeota archaeon]|nr:DNA topoisomerase VI subunit B [Candidatus Woesearchaeota archaeon]